VSLQDFGDERVVRCDLVADAKITTSDNSQMSFREFRAAIHPKLHWNWMVEKITDELQLFYEAFEDGKRPKLAIEMPPQHGKSLAAEDFIARCAGRQRSWKTIFASHSEALGTQRNRNLYRLFKSESYQNVFPDFFIEQKGWVCNTDLIEYCGDVGSFRNTTVEGTINGMELHLGVVDDYAKGRAEANSQVLRDKTWSWFTDDFFSRFAQKSAMLILCTRWHVDDVIGRYIKKTKLREIKASVSCNGDRNNSGPNRCPISLAKYIEIFSIPSELVCALDTREWW
jgi:hypothetical protein